MIPVSPRFLAALRQSHSISVAASVYAPDDPDTPIPLLVEGGTMTADRDARIRRQATLDVSLGGYGLGYDVAEALPYGGYATIERGIRYADGDIERVQLGRFRVEAVTWGALVGTATLRLADRMAQVQDDALVVPFAPAGLHPSDAAVALVHEVFGDAIAYRVETDPASEPIIGDAVYVDDRAAALSDLAAAADAWAVFDHQGNFLLRPRTPDPPPATSWAVDAGPGGSMLAVTETLERSSVRNGVLVRGQATSDQPPVSALATFDDPTSPLRWGGPFGRVALVSDSQAVATTAQAASAARSLLRLRLGLARTLQVRTLPAPFLEPDDLIELVYPDGRTEVQTVNGLGLGLAVDGALDLTATSLTDSTALGVRVGVEAMAALQGAHVYAEARW